MQGLIIAPKLTETSSSVLKFIKSETSSAAEQAEKMAKIEKAHEYLSPSKPMPDPANIKPEDNHNIDYFG